jgi:hypothetical protein
MDNQSARRATIILGIIMVIAIGSSAVLPLFSSTTQAVPTDAPTATIVPTFPAAITDFSTIQFNQDYLHPTGLFSVAEPTGWTIGTQPIKPDGAEVTMNNSTIFSVIQVSLQVGPQPLTSMDDLDAIYTTASLNQSWSNYRNPLETARTRQDNKLTIDFELQNARGQIFLARQTSWYDTDWVYSIRVVTPNNQIDLLKYLVDKEVASFKPNRIFAGMPADWDAYFDPTQNYIIRYPSNWKLTDSAPGLPASIDGDTDHLRVEVQSVSAPLDEAAARAWTENSRAGATVTSVQPVTRGSLTGFSVAYTYTDADGNSNSGLALLLNGANNTLYVANLRILESNVNLNQDDSQVTHDDLVKTLGSFQVLSGLNVPLPTATPTFTPLPPSNTPEVTATFTPTVTNTPEPPTATPTNTDTPVPPTATAVPPTSTPVPPTATAVPPTSTPIPPTATAVPPTSTPVPPSSTPVPTTVPTAEATAEATTG